MHPFFDSVNNGQKCAYCTLSSKLYHNKSCIKLLIERLRSMITELSLTGYLLDITNNLHVSTGIELRLAI